jgi:hypothetical protein
MELLECYLDGHQLAGRVMRKEFEFHALSTQGLSLGNCCGRQTSFAITFINFPEIGIVAKHVPALVRAVKMPKSIFWCKQKPF